MPRAIWERARTYVPHFEEVRLAGRFGAQPGDYEWEMIDQPQGFKWWRRTTMGDAAYYAAVVAPAPAADPLEVFGLIDIASDTPWWFDAVAEEGRLQGLSETLARQEQLDIDTARLRVSIRDEYGPRQLITAESDENGVAWRTGNAAEVKLLKDALIGLLDRARRATLPNEVRG